MLTIFSKTPSLMFDVVTQHEKLLTKLFPGKTVAWNRFLFGEKSKVEQYLQAKPFRVA